MTYVSLRSPNVSRYYQVDTSTWPMIEWCRYANRGDWTVRPRVNFWISGSQEQMLLTVRILHGYSKPVIFGLVLGKILLRTAHNVSKISPSVIPAPFENIGANWAIHKSWWPCTWNRLITQNMLSLSGRDKYGFLVTLCKNFLWYNQLCLPYCCVPQPDRRSSPYPSA